MATEGKSKRSPSGSSARRQSSAAEQKRRQRDQDEREELRDAVELIPMRVKVAVVGLVVTFLASWLFSGRGTGLWPAWPVSFGKAFINGGVTTVLLGVSVVVALVLAFAVPVFDVRRGGREKPAKAAGFTRSTVVLMVCLGLVVPISAWVEARNILPSTTFSMCVNSLKKDSTVALNDGEGGKRYVTVATVGEGVRKYALEQAPDSAKWQVTDMYTNRPVSNLSGC